MDPDTLDPQSRYKLLIGILQASSHPSKARQTHGCETPPTLRLRLEIAHSAVEAATIEAEGQAERGTGAIRGLG
jgi:hypothetical protein